MVKQKQFISSGNIASDFTSEVIDVQNFKRLGIELVGTTSDVNGTMYIQASVSRSNYDDLTDLNLTVAAANFTQVYDIDVSGFASIRVFFDQSSGSTGTLNGWYMIKD